VASQASIAIQNALLVESVRSHLQGLVSASEDRFRNLIEGSIQGVAIYRDLKPLFANHAYAQILGYPGVKEFLGNFTFEERFPVDEAVRMVKVQHAKDEAETRQQVYEVQATRREGQPVWLATIARRVTWDNGPAVQVTVNEITLRKAAEMKLRTSEERFRNLVEGSIQGFVIHRDGRLLFANDALARIFGFNTAGDLTDVRGWSDRA
jgi:PAS domain S-box-containing protein